MELLPVDLADTGAYALTELWAGLIHRKQDTGDFQLGIEFCLHRAHHIQHIRDTLAGKEMRLYGDDAVVRRRLCVHRQKLMLQAAVNDDIVVGTP